MIAFDAKQEKRCAIARNANHLARRILMLHEGGLTATEIVRALARLLRVGVGDAVSAARCRILNGLSATPRRDPRKNRPRLMEALAILPAY